MNAAAKRRMDASTDVSCVVETNLNATAIFVPVIPT